MPQQTRSKNREMKRTLHDNRLDELVRRADERLRQELSGETDSWCED